MFRHGLGLLALVLIPNQPLAAEPGNGKDLVPRLIDILNTTKSRDAYWTTLKVLEGLGAESKPAIPAIIKNAERLGFFQNYQDTDTVNRRYVWCNDIHEIILRIIAIKKLE
jgi:hypothetical protein